MSEDERAYFRQRAEAEIAAAQAAGHSGAARAHYVLAGYYLDLAYNPLASPMPPRAPPGREGAEGGPVTGEAAVA
jgi:hypothetical protein